MARPGLEPGTPRSSVVGWNLSNPGVIPAVQRSCQRLFPSSSRNLLSFRVDLGTGTRFGAQSARSGGTGGCMTSMRQELWQRPGNELRALPTREPFSKGAEHESRLRTERDIRRHADDNAVGRRRFRRTPDLVCGAWADGRGEHARTPMLPHARPREREEPPQAGVLLHRPRSPATPQRRWDARARRRVSSAAARGGCRRHHVGGARRQMSCANRARRPAAYMVPSRKAISSSVRS